MDILLHKSKFSAIVMLFFTSFVFAATNTYTGANGNWNTAANWSTGFVPTANDDVIIPSSKLVNISADSFAKSISVSGTLTVNDGVVFTIGSTTTSGNFTVNSGGSFSTANGSGLSTIIVYGNYINNGTTDFWKSTVIIVGDLLSPSTSGLQKQGNVVVGGNIIGDFNLTGGDGTGQIYAVNPNATVTITPVSIDNNVPPGTVISNPPETQVLVDLVNSVLYGSCPFTISGTANVTVCTSTPTASFTVTTSGSSPSYQWQMNSGSGWVDLTNSAPYSGVTTNTLTITISGTGLSGNKYRTKVTSGGCTKNGDYGTLTITTVAPSTPGNITGTTPQCPSNSGQIYTIAAVSGATSYNWAVPSGWSINSGNGTTSIFVTTGLVGNNGNITVTASNGCGTSAAKSFAVTVENATVTAGIIGGSASYCSYTNSTLLTLSGTSLPIGNGLAKASVVRWESSVDNFLTSTVIANTATTLTITNLSLTTMFRAVVLSNSGGCPEVSTPATITINTAPAIVLTSGIQSPTVCAGTAITTTVYTFSGSATSASVSGLPAGLSQVVDTTAKTVTISGTPTTGGTYTITTTGNATPCTAGSISGTITVNPFPSVPVIPSTFNLSCAATSFVVNWSASSNATKYRLDVATDAAFSTIVSPYNNLDLGNVVSTSVTGIPSAAVFYLRLRAENGCGYSSNSGAATVSVPVTKTTNGTTWDNGVPDNTKKAIFMSGGAIAPITAKITACSCQFGPNTNVKVGVPGGANTDAILNLVNGLDVDATSSLTFENNASLVQENDAAVNTGKIIYKRNTSLVSDFDYVYWCSPVKDQVLNVLSPNSDKYYSYWNGSWVPESGANTMNPAGKGFIIRVPRLYTTYSQAVQFEGIPNNGEVKVNVVTVKGNLIGNPYPSALDADAFLTYEGLHENKIYGGLYFWTHNTKRQQSGSQYVYSASDYAVYNLTGGTAALSTDVDGDGDLDGVIPSGEIAAGQSFFVPCNLPGQLYFNNSMRFSESGKNSQFFRPSSNTKKVATIEKNRIWLNLSNDGGAFKQLLVGYITGATNDLDNLFDGESMNGNVYLDFYSIINSKNYTIQGRGLPFDTTDQVPLGYKATIAGKFTISIDKVDGVLTNQAVYLVDKTTNNVQNLKDGAYSFTTEIGTFNDRFVLRYINATSKLGLGDVVVKDKGVVVSVKNSQIKINSFDQAISSVKVYDLKGSLIFEKNKVNLNAFVVDHLTTSNQFLIVMTQLESGKWTSEEIIFHD